MSKAACTPDSISKSIIDDGDRRLFTSFISATIISHEWMRSCMRLFHTAVSIHSV